ncbi:MAG: hypothetical protein SFU86_16185 [Pirellulaceae bacterium]|nr:hypothetical protein [Pirellulaceae bacterium]
MTHIDTPQSRCRAGVARGDVTPPVGIYHRMWGAALHDKATGVHRPLTATAVWLAPESSAADERQMVLALDHCILDRVEIDLIRTAIASRTTIAPEQVQVCLSHTHGSGWMSRTRSHFPGGELIGPYLDELATKCAALAAEAASKVQPAAIVYGAGRCSLAAQRDFRDVENQRYVCGLNPDGLADDTLLVARITADSGAVLATVVNYACHPTTLAWQNTLISPDYVGALREVVERQTAAPCLFLQGASGDLGPREGFVGDPAVADRNGRQVGFAALAALESLPPSGARFVYRGPVVSGAVLGTWEHEPLGSEELLKRQTWQVDRAVVELPYRPELPTLDETRSELTRWQAEEAAARAAGDEAKVRDCRAKAEQMTRQVARLTALPAGQAYPYEVRLLRLGDAIWLFLPGELYQAFQTTLRHRFPRHPLIIATIANDWQPGYVPLATAYGKGIYQDVIAAVAAGSLELLIEAVADQIAASLAKGC